MSKISDFIFANWRTLVLIYTIGAAVVFVGGFPEIMRHMADDFDNTPLYNFSIKNVIQDFLMYNNQVCTQRKDPAGGIFCHFRRKERKYNKIICPYENLEIPCLAKGLLFVKVVNWCDNKKRRKFNDFKLWT